ncbi:MAG: hypothetical protein SCH98_11815 [Deferrisomatales bacterium]|nr:hypothetical protein [Deferrisomatales bacterium]
MTRQVFAGIGPVFPGLLGAVREDVHALTGDGARPAVSGLVFLDPGDALRPLALAGELRTALRGVPFYLPLVCRDANRTALLGEARSAEVLGAGGLLLLAGRLEPGSRARAVYDLDPSQLLRYLREHGVGIDLWVAGRCETPAERGRLAALSRAGAARCLVPWGAGEPAPDGAGLAAAAWVSETEWAAGTVPAGEGDLLLQVGPGKGRAARDLALRLRGDG